MNTATRERAAEIFLALSTVATEDRQAKVEELCAGDADLRAEVIRLLDGLDFPDSFLGSLDTPPTVPGDVAVRPAGSVIGDFVVIRRIGAGGTGVVYIAHQRHPARIVALKVLRQEFVASAVQRRFEIEAELLAQLQHPGIAQVYAAYPGDAATPPYIAMELVNGPPLTEFADARNLSIADRVELVARVCDAVQHAHQRGIIHRDLKPGNILVNEDGQPKVLDFGVARTAGAAVSMTTIETQTGELVGTLPYMSPEQVLAEPNAIDTRTDIHALGVILFRLLAGRLPFGHDDPPLPELARRIAQDDPPKLSAFEPACRGDLEVIVARALAKEKERRYAAAGTLGTDLRRYLAGQPITASADSAWYLVRRQVRRYRLALGLSAAVLASVTALAVYANIQRARADRNTLETQRQLTTSTIDRGRLISLTGNLPVAEGLVWRELFRQPDSKHARWTLWDIYSREPSLWANTPHASGTQTVRFSPDGRWLATAGRLDGLIHLIDTGSGTIVRTFSAQPVSGTLRVFFTPDGTSLVSGSLDGTLRLWDLATGQVRSEIRAAAPGLEDLATVDGVHVVTAAKGSAKVWSLVDRRQIVDLTTLAKGVWRVAMSPTGRFVLAGSRFGIVTLIDFSRGASLWSQTHHGQTISVAFSPDGQFTAGGSQDSMLYFWETTTGRPVRTIETGNGRVRNLAFDQTGELLVVAGVWRTRVWNLNQPSFPPKDFGAAEGVTDAVISHDGQALATCDGGSGRVRMWDLSADARQAEWSTGKESVVSLTPPDAGGSFTVIGMDGVSFNWHPGQPGASVGVKTGRRVYAAALSQEASWLVTVGPAGTAAIWDAKSGTQAGALPEVPSGRAIAVADGAGRLFLGDATGTLRMWDWTDGTARNLRIIKSGDTELITLVARPPYVFAAHNDRSIIIRDIATGSEIRRVRGDSSPFALAASPDGKLFAAGTWLGDVDLWDVQTGRKVSELKGQTAVVSGVDFSPDGTLLASASRDGSTRLWDVAASQWLATVASRNVGAVRVRFFRDGRRIAIGYEDGVVEVRDLDYFLRHVAGHAEYQLKLLNAVGESYPRAGEVILWSQRVLAVKRATANPDR